MDRLLQLDRASTTKPDAMETSKMKWVAFFVAFFACSPAVEAQQADPNPPTKQSGASSYGGGTTEYTTATGRQLGSVTTIGGTMYFTDADGRALGTAETIDGHRVYKTY